MLTSLGANPALGPGPLAELAGVTAYLTAGARTALGKNFLGAYLLGSFALGAGDEHSDVDFLIVTVDAVDTRQESALRALHAAFPDQPQHWAQHLEGSYVPAAALRRPGRPPGRWLYVDNGSPRLEFSSHDDTAVLRWVMRSSGIVLDGPAPTSLLDPVDPADIRAESAGSLQRWARRLVDGAAGLDSAWEQQHTVLAVCRCLYSLSTGEVTSKVRSGRWAVGHLVATWVPLVERAIADRPDPWGRVHQPADPALVGPTRAFVAHGRRIALAADVG